MKKLVNKIIESGVKPGLTEDIKESIRLLNGITLIGIPICLFYTFLFGFTGFIVESVFFAIGILLFVLPIFQNKYLGDKVARISSTILTPIYFGIATVILGIDSGFYLGFLVIITPPLLLFETVKKAIPFVVFALICMTVAIVGVNLIDPISEIPYTRLIFMINLLSALGAELVIVGLFRNEVIQNRLVLRLKNKEILDSINYAKRIQTAILPPKEMVKKYFKQSFVFYQPKDIVAGDFYWIEPTKQGTLFAVGDCTGHGVPGAIVSVICTNALNRAVRENKLIIPATILDRTREIVISEFEKSEEEVRDGMDIALCRLDGDTLHYSGANNPIWIVRNKEILEIKGDKQPIGNNGVANPFTNHEIELFKGDLIYLFSDGFSDQFGGEKGKKFKYKPFRELILSNVGIPMKEQKSELMRSLRSWMRDYEQVDDICIMAIKV